MFRDTNQNYTYYHEDNNTENTLFRKDYTNVVGRLLPINLVLKDSFVKVGTDIVYSKEVRAFVDSISDSAQQQYKKLIDIRLIECKKLISDAITKNNFVTPAKSAAKADAKKTPSLKESEFNT